MQRIFLLSPAHCGGKRAQIVMSERARFPLAVRLRSRGGAPLGDVFSFLSGLYFRGKVAYARAFARPPEGAPGALVITAGRGLLPLDAPVGLAALRRFAAIPIDRGEARYRRPLLRHARALGGAHAGCELVLLGSIASPKYIEPLLDAFGERLRFPVDFVGRGDMSRGGLMLRCADEGRELPYAPVAGAVRHGRRPPRLERRS